MKIGLFILLVVQGYCAHGHTVADVLEAAAVLKSNARTAFHSDQHFASKIESLHALVTDRTSASRQSSHPFLVRTHDDCQSDCTMRYAQHFTSKRIVHLSKKFVLITASAAEMETFAAENTGVVKFHFPMIPEMKIEADVASIARTKNCDISEVGIHMRHADKHITEAPVRTFSEMTLRIVMTPLADKEVADFLKFAHDSSKLSANTLPFTYQYAKRQRTGEKQYLEVTLSDCAHVESVSKMFARRREVMWIERKYPAFTHNRWAKGVCDTADAASKPLETNSAANFTGRGDIIGVIDTGIDMKNCYFRDDDVATPYVQPDDATSSTPNYNHRKVVQYYTYADSGEDSSGHGTHVSGISAGHPIERYGDYKTYEGMNIDAKIAFFDIGKQNHSGLLTPPDLNTGLFQIMYQANARIFTNSWGTSSNKYDVDAVSVDTFMWENPDCLVLFSAGNSGAGGGNTVNSPGTAKNVATVGATLNDHDSWLAYEGETDEAYGIDAIAGFSSQGPTKDNRLKPDVLAPGFWTTSALGAFNSSEDFCSVIALRGTSMACPTAAGFALKIRRYFLDGFYPGGVRNETAGFIPSGALLKGMLVHSSQKMSYRVGANDHLVTNIATYPSNMQGYGRIQMDKVLNFAQSSRNPVNLFVVGSAFDSEPNYAAITLVSQVDTYDFVMSNTGAFAPLRVTLAYTDLPGSELDNEVAGEALKNVLTIEVTSNVNPDVTTPYLVSGTFLSNVQVIDITASPGAIYTVTVRCTNLLLGPQPYALIVTGQTTYLADGTADTETYSVPTDNFTADGGALKYIVALGVLALFLICLVYHIRKVSKKHTDMMVDPQSYEEDGDLFEDDGRSAGPGKKSVFAKIRSIRSNHRKAQQGRNQGDNEGYYE